MNETHFDSIFADADLFDDLRAYASSPKIWRKLQTFDADMKSIDGPTVEELRKAAARSPEIEAIVSTFGRPALLVRDDSFELPAADAWRDRLTPTKSLLEKAIRGVGRVNVANHASLDWIGTAWHIGDGVVVTNRHVASELAFKREGAAVFRRGRDGKPMRPSIDFKQEYQVDDIVEVKVTDVIYLADDDETVPDVALLKLDKSDRLPPPLPLSSAPIADVRWVATIGFPAHDSRESAGAMAEVFKGVYDVKRFSPGAVKEGPSPFILHHDCSTLGGSSGSPLVDVATGAVIGLHFAGRSRAANSAVKVAALLELAKGFQIQVTVPEAIGPRLDEERRQSRRNADGYAGRAGYQPSFLGEGLEVPLPKLRDDLVPDIAKIAGTEDDVLRYTHFSTMQNARRKSPFFTAVNIDGGTLRRIPRKGDAWYFDPRLPEDQQTGPEVYADNDLDRGHMVRRLDPVWGPEAEAANEDTFHFTNACPQHKDLNQKIWNDLEDYVLDNAEASGLKVNVFTGPVLAEDDPPYRGVQLPKQFWKVVVIGKKDGDTLSLHATAYIQSQAEMIRELEFVYGQFETYQISVREVEGLTGLDFGSLRDVDPLGKNEARGGRRPLASVRDIVL